MSYNDKHNEANGEGNNDGESHNRSWNCGVEGPTDDLEVLALRERQQRNFLTTLFLSPGRADAAARRRARPHPARATTTSTARTTRSPGSTGSDARQNWALTDFTGRLARLRREHPVFRRRRFFQGDPSRGSESELGDIAWFTPGGEHDERRATGRSATPGRSPSSSTATRIAEPDARGERVADDSFLLLFNAHHEDIDFTIPREVYGERWQAVLDTAAPVVDDRPTAKAGEPVTARVAVASWCCAGWSERPVTDPRTPPTADLPPPAPPGLRLRRRRAPCCPTSHDLGVSHVYLSPDPAGGAGLDRTATTSSTTPGSATSSAARTAFDAAVATPPRAHGLGIVVDVVPNHMAVPTPGIAQRARCGRCCATGPASPYAALVRRRLGGAGARHPDAGARPPHRRGASRDGELTLDRGPAPSRCCATSTTCFPVRPGTADLPLAELLDRQFYRLAHWRVGDEELNYRRFFDVDTLVGVRVEDERGLRRDPRACCWRWSPRAASTACASTTPTASPTRAATSRRLRRARPAAPGSSSRRSSRATRSCPPTGRAPARPGYDALLRVGGRVRRPGVGAGR